MGTEPEDRAKPIWKSAAPADRLALPVPAARERRSPSAGCFRQPLTGPPETPKAQPGRQAALKRRPPAPGSWRELLRRWLERSAGAGVTGGAASFGASIFAVSDLGASCLAVSGLVSPDGFVPSGLAASSLAGSAAGLSSFAGPAVAGSSLFVSGLLVSLGSSAPRLAALAQALLGRELAAVRATLTGFWRRGFGWLGTLLRRPRQPLAVAAPAFASPCGLTPSASGLAA